MVRIDVRGSVDKRALPLRLFVTGVVIVLGWMPSATAEQAVSNTIRDCPDCPEMVPVADARDGGGALWVAVNETTYAEYLASVKDGACEPPHLMNKATWATREVIVSTLGRSNYAVVGVSFAKIACYAAWLSSKKGRHYRLPTETEWERFARAGVKTRFPWGDTMPPEMASLHFNTTLKANSMYGIGLNNYKGLPVRSFSPNRAGIYDVVGNVFELTNTCFQVELNSLSVEEKENKNCRFVIRGGSWGWAFDDSIGLSDRQSVQSTPEMNEAGFRLVAEEN